MSDEEVDCSFGTSMANPLAERGGVLLPWEVTIEEAVLPAGRAATIAAAAAPPPPLSLVDRLAAPLSFMHQALVFQQPLDADKLRQALAQALALLPTLACRATQDEVRRLLVCCLFSAAGPASIKLPTA